MAFRPFSAGSNGAWIDSASAAEFGVLAAEIKAMSSQVQSQALAAAQEHLAGPAVAAGAHPAVSAFASGESVYVGVPPNHPAASAVANQEYGTPTQFAGGHIRRVLRDNAQTSFNAFTSGLGG